MDPLNRPLKKDPLAFLNGKTLESEKTEKTAGDVVIIQ
jgi:hypothetical protein